MPFEVVQDITLKQVTLATGKGALGTWRSPGSQRRVSEEPSLKDEPGGKPKREGVYASQRLSLARLGKASRGKPRSEPDSGNPTVRDRRGASGNVAMGAGLRAMAKAMESPPDPKARAPDFYPDPLQRSSRPGSYPSDRGGSAEIEGGAVNRWVIGAV